ncbi:MAG TPA: 2TM domain-containing protein [Ktedonobacterales bacterium]|nr:2TM domain-containing protein [Ktedonobacterales bacterium]
MDNDNQQLQRYERARARVKQLRNLYIHAGVFVLVNLQLLVVNLVTNAQSLWFYWPLLTWSVVLAAHAIIVLGTAGSLATHWEQRKIRELMERDAPPDVKGEGASPRS